MALKYLLVLIVMLGVTVSKSVFARPESSSYLVLPENMETSQLREYGDNYYEDSANVNAEYQMKQVLNRYPLQKVVHYPQKWYPAPQNQIIDQGIQKLYKEKPVFKPQDFVKPEIENVVTDKRTSNSCKYIQYSQSLYAYPK